MFQRKLKAIRTNLFLRLQDCCKRDSYKVLQTNSTNVYLRGLVAVSSHEGKAYAYSESSSMPKSLELSQKKIINIQITS